MQKKSTKVIYYISLRVSIVNITATLSPITRTNKSERKLLLSLSLWFCHIYQLSEYILSHIQRNIYKHRPTYNERSHYRNCQSAAWVSLNIHLSAPKTLTARTYSERGQFNEFDAFGLRPHRNRHNASNNKTIAVCFYHFVLIRWCTLQLRQHVVVRMQLTRCACAYSLEVSENRAIAEADRFNVSSSHFWAISSFIQASIVTTGVFFFLWELRASWKTKSVMEEIVQFRNCQLIRDHRLVDEDLWIQNGKIIDPEPIFFDRQVGAHRQIDCHGATIVPGFIDIQINGEIEQKYFIFEILSVSLINFRRFSDFYISDFNIFSLSRIFCISCDPLRTPTKNAHHQQVVLVLTSPTIRTTSSMAYRK